jgi:myo-inositol-1(or 4)-monophosphatase
VPHFSVTVGVEDRDGLLAGAVLDPLRGGLFTAAHGGGAFLNGARLAVSGCQRLLDALLVPGLACDSHQNAARALPIFGDFTVRATSIRRLRSAALDLAYVAAGRLDGFWEERLHAWDIAAGALVVREAGGRVTDLAGGDGMLASGDILAAPPAMLGLMQEVLAASSRPALP